MWNTLASVIVKSWNEVGRQLGQALPNLIAAFLLLGLGVLAGVIVGRVHGSRKRANTSRRNRFTTGGSRIRVARVCHLVGSE